jgi:hypothetical protein
VAPGREATKVHGLSAATDVALKMENRVMSVSFFPGLIPPSTQRLIDCASFTPAS